MLITKEEVSIELLTHLYETFGIKAKYNNGYIYLTKEEE